MALHAIAAHCRYLPQSKTRNDSARFALKRKNLFSERQARSHSNLWGTSARLRHEHLFESSCPCLVCAFSCRPDRDRSEVIFPLELNSSRASSGRDGIAQLLDRCFG